MLCFSLRLWYPLRPLKYVLFIRVLVALLLLLLLLLWLVLLWLCWFWCRRWLCFFVLVLGCCAPPLALLCVCCNLLFTEGYVVAWFG